MRYATTDDVLPPEDPNPLAPAPRRKRATPGGGIVLALLGVLLLCACFGPLVVAVVGFSCLTVYAVMLAVMALHRSVWS